MFSPGWSVRIAWKRCPSTSLKVSCAGVRALAPDDHPRALRPSCEINVLGDLCDLPVGALGVVLIHGSDPGVIGGLEDPGAHRVAQVIADRVADPPFVAPVQQLVRRPSRVDPEQQIDLFDVLDGDLLQSLLGDGDLVGGGVRARVAGSQLTGQRLAGLIRVGEQRVKAIAALERARRPVLLGMAGDQRRVQVDRQLARGAKELPRPCSRPGVCGPQPLQAGRVTRDLIDESERRRGRGNTPEQRRLITHRLQVREAVPAVGKHHRQVCDHAAGVVSAAPLAHPAQPDRQCPRQARLLSHTGQQRAARVRHQAVSVRRDFYGNPALIMRHPQGDPPESVLRSSTTRRIPAQADSSAAPTIGAAAASCTIRASDTGVISKYRGRDPERVLVRYSVQDAFQHLLARRSSPSPDREAPRASAQDSIARQRWRRLASA